jgi:CubicO group peptidase (beta-lactamase class C family)
MGMLNPNALTRRTFANPPMLANVESYNDRDLLRLELPAANGVGLVRDIAKAYSEFATGGNVLQLQPETLMALEEPAHPPRDGLFDQVMKLDTMFSLGYIKPFDGLRFGKDTRAFGTPGAGGSFAFADPKAQVGFAYAMNKSGFYVWDDPREKALRDALYRCID